MVNFPKFKKSRKGYDLKEVDDYTTELLEKLETSEQSIKDLEDAQKNTSLKSLDLNSTNIDEETLVEMVGQSAAALINTAKKQALLTEKSAAEEADVIIESAKENVKDIHDRAEKAFKERVDAAKAEADRLTQEALSIRYKTLEDMSRRKKELSAQVERLMAGRNRLINSFESSQKVLNEIKGKVTQSIGEAKIAADAAANRVTSKPEPTPAELEQEITAAKLLGLPSSRFASASNVDVSNIDAPTLDTPTKEKLEEPEKIIEKEEVIAPEEPESKEINIELELQEQELQISVPNLDKAVEDLSTQDFKKATSLFEKLREEKVEEPIVKKLIKDKQPKRTPIKEEVEEVIKIEKEEVITPEEPESKEPDTDYIIKKLSLSLERQIKYGLTQDQNLVLDALRQKKRNKELPPVETQTAAYIEAINNEELSEVAEQEVRVSEDMLIEMLVQPLRENLDDCFSDDEQDPQKEIRNSYRNFKQLECPKIAQDIAERVFQLN